MIAPTHRFSSLTRRLVAALIPNLPVRHEPAMVLVPARVVPPTGASAPSARLQR